MTRAGEMASLGLGLGLLGLTIGLFGKITKKVSNGAKKGKKVKNMWGL